MSLSVNRLIRTSVLLSPLAASRRGFGILCIAGDSNIIDASERIRSYTDIAGVAADFGTTAPEYEAAGLYFGQSPKPASLMIGRWLGTATAGFVKGATLTPTERLVATWTAIGDGEFSVAVDGGTSQDVTGLDFTGETNLNGVATVITGGLTGAVCTWSGNRFTITSSTTGVDSEVGYVTDTAGSGTDISAMLKLTAGTATSNIPGADGETALECATALAAKSTAWYGLTFAADTMPNGAALQAVAGMIQTATPARIFGVTETDTRVMDGEYTTDLASEMKALLYTRTSVQYSPNPYAVVSFMGRAFSVNFNANRSTITLMWKTEPGIVAEDLTESQAAALKTKRCNVFANYDNDTAIIQYGVMSGPAYFDEIHGLDWLANAVQTELYNLLYTSKTKIPQTDAGCNSLMAPAAGVLAQAVNNGLIAPGPWNSDGFGTLERGDYLASGYYIFMPSIDDQSQADRDTRVAPPMQIAVKLAGAIQEVDCIISVNR